MKYNRIIMFCDYGLDDAIATMHILRRADMFEKIDIVPIGGNVSVHTAFRNAQTLLASADVDTDKVRIIDTRNIPQQSADIPDIHGSDGIGDVLPQATSKAAVVDFSAFKAELETSARPDRDCVLSLGPCTLPVMLDYTPFCTVLMGGAVKELPNYGDYEFNEALDVSAFAKYAFGATAVATLDTCHDENFGFENFQTGDPLTDKLVSSYKNLCASRDATFAIYDYVAALAVTDAQLFEAERVRRADGVEFNELRLIAK